METSTYGLSAELLAELTGSSLDSTKRWKRRGRVPNARQVALKLALEGNLGAIHQDWHGFVLKDGEIWTPENFPVRAGELRSIPYRRMLISDLQRKLAEPQQWKLI